MAKRYEVELGEAPPPTPPPEDRDVTPPPHKGKNKFNARMREKGFLSDRGNYNKMEWRGIRLLTDEDSVTFVTSVIENTETSLPARAREKVTQKEVTKVTKVTKVIIPDKPCAGCGENKPVLDEKHGAYRCSECQRFYTVKADDE